MAKCGTCDRDMKAAEGCLDRRLVYDADPENSTADGLTADELVEPITYGDELIYKNNNEPPSYCRVCGVTFGNYHHPGCDMEECPNCGGMLSSCHCHPLPVFQSGVE